MYWRNDSFCAIWYLFEIIRLSIKAETASIKTAHFLSRTPRLETDEFWRIMQNGKSEGTVNNFYEKWANVTHLIMHNVRNLSKLHNSFSGAFDFCGRSSTQAGESTAPRAHRRKPCHFFTIIAKPLAINISLLWWDVCTFMAKWRLLGCKSEGTTPLSIATPHSDVGIRLKKNHHTFESRY